MVWGGGDFMSYQFLYKNFELGVTSALVFLAALTKSAQIPFSAWLPAAIAAPTPVSSLVHSSTLVTAGVYLIIRFNLIINLRFYLIITSLITIFIRAFSALYESDLKKVIALSTLSQLGLMIFSLSLGLKDLAFFHLIRHAMFKSLIFLCAGAYIHFYNGSQESRIASYLPNFSTLFSIYFLYSNLSLIGIFFLSGFYSKDLIIEGLILVETKLFVTLLIYLSVILTLGYTIRLLNLCVNLFLKCPAIIFSKAEDLIMYSPMFVLFILSLGGRGAIRWLIFPLSLNYLIITIKIIVPLILVFFILKTVNKYLNLSYIFSFFYLGKMWSLSLVFSVRSQILLKTCDKIVISIDQGWLEFLGPQGIKTLTPPLLKNRDKINSLKLNSILTLLFFIFFLIVLLIYLNSLN